MVMRSPLLLSYFSLAEHHVTLLSVVLAGSGFRRSAVHCHSLRAESERGGSVCASAPSWTHQNTQQIQTVPATASETTTWFNACGGRENVSVPLISTSPWQH